MVIVIVVVAVVAIVALAIGLSYWNDRKRRLALEAVAEQLGLEFIAEGSEQLQSELLAFKLFNSGRSKKLTKLIRGQTDEVAISIFDYQYTTGSGDSSHTFKQTVGAIQSPELKICDFSMRPENMLDKIGGMMGFQDIDFESHPKFSGMFVLKGTTENLVRSLFKPAVLEFFESKNGLSVEGVSGKIVFYRPGKTISPDNMKLFLSEAYEIYGAFVDNL